MAFLVLAQFGQGGSVGLGELATGTRFLEYSSGLAGESKALGLLFGQALGAVSNGGLFLGPGLLGSLGGFLRGLGGFLRGLGRLLGLGFLCHGIVLLG